MTDTEPLRIATRSSPLATAQARAVAEALPREAELVGIATRGDRAAGALTEIGGKGLFTAELAAALRAGKVQLAVHSAKDLPADMPGEFVIAAVPPREDPRDALVSADGAGPDELPDGARVGTSSLRRAAQIKLLRPEVKVEPVRGNVESRLRKLRQGQYDAVILAVAGLKRLGLLEELGRAVRPLAAEEFVPAAGQGALAVQCLAADAATRALAATVSDPDSAAALAAERDVVRQLGATCRSAVGVHVRRQGDAWQAVGLAAAPDGAKVIRLIVSAETADRAARKLLGRMEQAQARQLLAGG